MAIIISVILILLGIAILMFIHVCVVGRALRGDNFESETIVGSNNNNNGGDARLCKNELEKLPCFEYMTAMEHHQKGSPVDCAICLGKFEIREKCRMLPICKHGFHAKCVDEWLLVTPICPICRTSVVLESSIKGCGGEGNSISIISSSN